jgi:putative nucleotidyltransferase with HDIG domain
LEALACTSPVGRELETGIQLKGVSTMGRRWIGSGLRERLAEVNKELWLILSLMVIAAILNFLVAPHRILLGLYTLPTLFSAYFYGRRHATLTAVASVLVVTLVVHFNSTLLARPDQAPLPGERWYDLALWAGILVITAYAMGTLYDRKEARVRELRETYKGILFILRQFISKDKYTQNHSYRVSIYATAIAARLGLDRERIEDVRAAAFLHDIGKLDISREILYKAASLTEEEYTEIRRHVEEGVEILGTVGGSLRRVIPIVLAHHDKFDGSGYHPTRGEKIPLEARIISVADVYDSLTSDRPYRKGVPSFDARDIILKGAGTEFDPRVVEGFLEAFRRGEMEVPDIVV